LKFQFFAKVPETLLHFTDMPPVYTKLLGQKLGHAIGSFAMASGGPAKSGQTGGVLGLEKGGGGA
jgi:glutaminase